MTYVPAAVPNWEELTFSWWLVPLAACALAVLYVLARKIVWRIFGVDTALETALRRQKQADVKMGKVSEALAPFLDNFPVDIRKPGTSTIFLGQPIDFLHFDPDEGVTFIEVKSSDSKLSGTQRKLRELVREGKVRWADVRVK